MWDKLRTTALITALLAGTAAVALAQSSSTLGTGGSAAGGTSVGTSSTLGTGGSTAGTGKKSTTGTSSTLGTGGTTAGTARSGSSSTLGTAGTTAGSNTGMTQRRAHRWHHGRHL